MTLEGLLERYGQAVTLHPAGEGAAVEVRAFVQPVRERGEGWRDTLPTPLGLRRRERRDPGPREHDPRRDHPR